MVQTTSANTINPSAFGISPQYGFLSPDAPLHAFNDEYYAPWDDIVASLPLLIRSGQLDTQVTRLPILQTNRLSGDLDYRRAYVVLAFIIHGHVWGQSPPNECIPPQLSEPFLDVCNHVGMEPVVSYAGLCIWNWKFRNGETFELDNMDPVASFTGTKGEAVFYHVPVLVEYEGGRLLHILVDAIGAAANGGRDTVIEGLNETTRSIIRMGDQMSKVYANIDANYFYHKHRPFMAGGKGMEEKGLPRGMVFQKIDGSEVACKLVGGSAAQSSLFPFLDLVLGVEHGDNALFMEMRAYMPGAHRDFLSQVAQLPSLREYVEANAEDNELREAYDDCMKKLRAWRGKHIAVVSKFIVQPAREAARAASVEKLEVDGATNTDEDLELQGTGGSALIPFLRGARDDTVGVH